jgi:hypothetical protein
MMGGIGLRIDHAETLIFMRGCRSFVDEAHQVAVVEEARADRSDF